MKCEICGKECQDDFEIILIGGITFISTCSNCNKTLSQNGNINMVLIPQLNITIKKAKKIIKKGGKKIK